MLVHLENSKDVGRKGKAMISGMLDLLDDMVWMTPHILIVMQFCVFYQREVSAGL